MRHIAALTLATALLIAAATASASIAIRWKPAKMAAALTALKYPHAGTLGGTCAGVGKRAVAGYTGFRCVMTWQTTGPPLKSGKVTVYARPLVKGHVCASTRSLKACHALAAGPLPGDPTVCSYPDKGQCATDAAQAAVRHQIGEGDITCTLSSALTANPVAFSCTMKGAGSYAVAFTRGTSAWATTVTPSP